MSKVTQIVKQNGHFSQALCGVKSPIHFIASCCRLSKCAGNVAGDSSFRAGRSKCCSLIPGVRESWWWAAGEEALEAVKGRQFWQVRVEAEGRPSLCACAPAVPLPRVLISGPHEATAALGRFLPIVTSHSGPPCPLPPAYQK